MAKIDAKLPFNSETVPAYYETLLRPIMKHFESPSIKSIKILNALKNCYWDIRILGKKYFER